MTKIEMMKAVKQYKDYHFTEYVRDDYRLGNCIDYLATLNDVVLEFLDLQLNVVLHQPYNEKTKNQILLLCKKQIEELNRFTDDWRKAKVGLPVIEL